MYQHAIVSLATLLLLQQPHSASAQQSCSKRDMPQTIDARIDALIAKMTIPERIAQLQDRAPGIPRLGLPAYNWWNEGLHGLARDGYATVFPQAIGLAATWDPDLLHAVGDVVSTEARVKFNSHHSRSREESPRYGGLTVWSPNINIFRDPRWGRGQETYGEDPFLTSTLGSQFVRGVQGEDPFYLKANATPKHFVAHSGPEEGRDSFNSVVTAHDLADTYLRGFHALTTDAHAAAMMCSYNEINGTPSCANDSLLQATVRDGWGFTGYVVSDCDAVGDITDYHHFTKDAAHGAALALNAGTDLDCGNTYAALEQSYKQGLVTEATINRALHRLLVARVHLGMLDAAHCTPYDNLGADALDTSAHQQLARKAAEESIVLLHNEGALPLKPATRLAVIGPTADNLKILEANYHGTAKAPVTPLEGLLSTFEHVQYAQGSLLANGLPLPIPRNALRQGAEAKAPTGLHAEFFNIASVEGKPAAEATVARVDLDLDRVGPTPAITGKQYAARWSGYLQPPAAGDYTLKVDIERCWDCTTHDQFRLYVDGQLALDNHGKKGEPAETTLHAADTKPHAVRLELLHTGEDEGIALEWVPPAAALLQQANETAQQADAIVAFLGLSPDLEGEALQVKLPGFAGGDRTSLDIPAAQQELLQALLATGKPVTVVLTSGSAVTLGDSTQQPKALLEAWYGGEQMGNAVADVISGKTSPSGRLPVTFYRSVADLPAFTDYSMAHRTYRYFNGPVLYPFGFGLSYTHFSYGTVHLLQSSVDAGAPLTATVTLRNDGPQTGTEVSELYLQPPPSDLAPRVALAGIQRVELKPGESRELTFTLQPEQMGVADAAGQRTVRPGTYKLFLGSTQPDLATATASATVTVRGSKALPTLIAPSAVARSN